MKARQDPRSQVPPLGEVVLDHLGLFVEDIENAPTRLEALGFTLTPVALHKSASGPQGTATLSGTANRCAMFGEGYLEILGPRVDTLLSQQLRTALARYPGLHLIAFGAADAAARHGAVAAAGFAPLPLVRLERPIPTQAGEAPGRFEVLRLPPGTMPEGRIQICTHLTPELLWQNRYLRQPNGTEALSGVLIAVEDPLEAADRFARFLALPAPQPSPTGDAAGGAEGAQAVLNLARGRVGFVTPSRLAEPLLGEPPPCPPPPCLPWIAEMYLRVASLRATGAFLAARGIDTVPSTDGSLRVAGKDALGAGLVFHEGALKPWLS